MTSAWLIQRVWRLVSPLLTSDIQNEPLQYPHKMYGGHSVNSEVKRTSGSALERFAEIALATRPHILLAQFTFLPVFT